MRFWTFSLWNAWYFGIGLDENHTCENRSKFKTTSCHVAAFESLKMNQSQQRMAAESSDEKSNSGFWGDVEECSGELELSRVSPLLFFLPPNSSKVFLASAPPPSAHSRQRQKSVGMKTPNATRMGNIRLLLSVAYGFGVLGPDWTRDLETAWARFFPPSSPPSLSSSSSSSSSCFSRPGWGCSFGTSVTGRWSQIIPGNKSVFNTAGGAKPDLCSRAQHGHRNPSRLQISEKKHSWSFQGWLETANLVKQVCVFKETPVW